MMRDVTNHGIGFTCRISKERNMDGKDRLAWPI